MTNKSRVLIVDDEDIIRKIVSCFLGKENYTLLEASNAEDALKILSSTWIDLVLLDVNLPDMDGLELCRTIREDANIGLLPIVIMTAGGPETYTKALEAGADDFLPKPFVGAELIARVSTTTKLGRYRQIRTEQERFQRLIESAPCGWLLLDPAGSIIDSNRFFREIVGDNGRDNRGTLRGPLAEFIHNDDKFLLEQWLNSAQQVPMTSLQLSLVSNDGREIPVELEQAELRKGVNTFHQIFIKDLSNQHKTEELLFRSAYLDSLCALPNRRLLCQLMDEVVSEGDSTDPRCPGLLLLDLDHFRKINESYGHTFGDSLLKAVAARLESSLSISHLLARVGGDEFAVFVSRPCPLPVLWKLAKSLTQTLQAPFIVDGRETHVQASIGIAHGWERGETLLRFAHAAVTQAKIRSRGAAITFEQPMAKSAEGFTSIAGDLQRALAKGEFYVVYQPMIDLNTGRILGFEALLRWKHPRLGQISPIKFIPVAEKTGFIIELGNLVIERACEQLRLWKNALKTDNPLCIHVNVSPVQLQDHVSGAFQNKIYSLLARFDLSPGDLKLEITESTILEGCEGQNQFFSGMKKAGVRLQIDDFGTGYSNLAYLTRLPLDALKIDRSFVKRFDDKKADGEIIKAIVNLGNSLNLETVAEGVETQEQATFLRNLGCTYAQGYLYAKPMQSNEALQYLNVAGGYWSGTRSYL